MSFSNRDAAIRLFTHANVDVYGSNLYITRLNPSDPHSTANAEYPGFTVHSVVTSYRTTIAQLMQRVDPDDNGNPVYELWTTSSRYSPTTDRHMHWLRNALYMANSHSSHLKPFTSMRGACPITVNTGAIAHYTVPQRDSNRLSHRNDPELLKLAIMVAKRNAALATQPRIHSTTRVQYLTGARGVVERALFIATDCASTSATRAFPDYAAYVEAAQAYSAYLHGLAASPVAEFRAALEAVQALDRY